MGTLHGYEIESELPLRRLSAAPAVRGSLRLEAAPESPLDRAGELTAWLEWPGMEGGFALARTDRGLVAWCSQTGTFEIDAPGRTIRVADATADDAWENRLHTTAVPLLLSELGDLALHASAVSLGGRAILFCGPSGRGKSTLAAYAGRLGHPALTDDGAIVTFERSGPTAWAGARGVKTSDGTRNGAAVDADLHASSPATVTAICHLAERGSKLEVARLSPTAGLPPLVPSLIHAGGPDPLRLAFTRLARALECVPVYRITMPDRITAAPDATRALLEQVAA